MLIVSIFTSTAWASWNDNDTAAGWDSNEMWSSGSGSNVGFSLLGLLVLIAALMLLFTGRYQHPLFDLVMGINRWIYRVATYTLLLRDEYPPFKLDQGPEDPSNTEIPPSISAPPANKAPVASPEKPSHTGNG